MMSCAIIVHGAVSSGKTGTCLELVERARAIGITVGGILSIRAYRDTELIDYDGLDLMSRDVFPLVRRKTVVDGPDWFLFSDLVYAFSVRGFERANSILRHSVETLSSSSIIFIDEFGRLERAGLGIYPGALRVAEKLKAGGIALFTCRTDLVDAVEDLVRDKAESIIRFEPNNLESLWSTVLKNIDHAELDI